MGNTSTDRVNQPRPIPKVIFSPDFKSVLLDEDNLFSAPNSTKVEFAKWLKAEIKGGNFIDSQEQTFSLHHLQFGELAVRIHPKGVEVLLLELKKGVKKTLGISNPQLFLNYLNTTFFFIDAEGIIQQSRFFLRDSSLTWPANGEQFSAVVELVEKSHQQVFSGFLHATEKSTLQNVPLLMSNGKTKYYDLEKINIKSDNDFGTLIIFNSTEEKEAILKQKVRAEIAEEINKILKLEIDQHRKTQYSLVNAKNQYKDLFDNANDLIYGFDLDGKLVFANRAWKLAFGAESLDNFEINKYLTKESQEVYKKQLEKFIRYPNIREYVQYTYHLKGNSQLILEESWFPEMKEGKLVGIRSVARDITDVKEAEDIAKENFNKLQAIVNAGNIFVWTVDARLALTYFNKKYSDAVFELYGVYPEINTDPKRDRKKFAPEEYHQQWESKYRQAFAGETVSFQTRTVTKKGEIRHREIYLTPIIDLETGYIKEVAGLGMDISDRQEAEAKIKEKESQIQAIFDSSTHLIWSLDSLLVLQSFNENFLDHFKRYYGIEPKVGFEMGKQLIKRLAFKKHNIWLDNYKKALGGESVHFEINLELRKTSEDWLEVYMNPMYNNANLITGISVIAHSVNFKKQAERKIKEQAAKINSIFNSTAVLIYSLDRENRVTSYNKNFAAVYKRLTGKSINIGDAFLEHMLPYVAELGRAEYPRLFQRAFSGEQQQFETQVFSHMGEMRWLETFINPIMQGDGQVLELSCMANDITDRKLSSQRIKESLREKEVLLQEVHHRVKNNLQIISSILNLQSAYVKDVNTLDILKESQNRIKTMSFIHETLYQTKDFSSIDFGEYLMSLTKNLIHSYSMHGTDIKLHTELDQVHLALDQAIPCGLIVNELISNSLKYAFPKRKEGQLFISCKEQAGKVTLEIQDNGIGLPSDFDLENSESLGLQLVFTLVDQIDGVLDYKSENGTKYLLTFVKL